jgi:nucleotide-binding universal stress UspA family protein
MYRTIIAGYEQHDDAAHSEALALAEALAEPAGASVIVATVVSLPAYYQGEGSVAEELEHRAEEHVKDVLRGRLASVRVRPEVISAPSAAGALHRLAERERADLIVVGSTHLGRVGRVLIGSTAERLLSGAPCAVAVAPHGYEGPPEGIREVGVAFDASDESREALAWAAGTAAALGADLRVIAVVVPWPLPGHPTKFTWPQARLEETLAEVRDDLGRELDEAISELPAELRRTTLTRTGDPAAELRSESEALDLLVTGARGYGPLRSVLLGSVSHALAQDCPAPLVVIPRRGDRHGAPRESVASGGRRA